MDEIQIGKVETTVEVPDWRIPHISGGNPFELVLQQGEVVIVIGPNGAGKSALSYWLSTNSPKRPVRRIYAQRQVWLASASPDITSNSRNSYESIFERFDAKPESRVNFEQGERRSASLLFDLLARENQRNAKFAEIIEGGGTVEAANRSAGPSLFRMISRLMRDSGFSQEFKLGDNNSIEAKAQGGTFPISEMSDGEKAAFLLAAEVLLAPEEAVILVDEPERHLHRAISSNFVTQLANERRDCSFVFFTHDINLMATGLRTLVVSSVRWRDRNPIGWELEELEPGGERDERARLAVLGGRGQVLLIEGEIFSLDKALYEILYPGWTIQPVGSSSQVIRAVSGIMSSRKHHWLEARGIVDGDCRTQEERTALQSRGVLVLPVNEIENIYVLPRIVEYLAKKQEDALGRPWQDAYKSAQESALNSLADEKVQSNLATKNAIKILRQNAMERIPHDASALQREQIDIHIESPWKAELSDLKNAVSRGKHARIIKRFSIRESAYGSRIAKGLGYANEDFYRDAVLHSLKKDEGLRAEIVDFLGELHILAND